MRFNSDAYDKVFPRQIEPDVIETVVETFTPTSDEVYEDKEEIDIGNGTDSELDS